MCEATVYLDDKMIWEDVMSIQVVPGGVRITPMFKPPVFVPAAVEEIDLSNHRVRLVPLPKTK